MRQPHHQFVLFKTFTAVGKKERKKKKQKQNQNTITKHNTKSFPSTKTWNKTHMQIPDGQNSKILLPMVWQTSICLQMWKNISSDTTEPHRLSLSTFSSKHSILKSSCKLTDWTLVWLPSADPRFWEPEELFKNTAFKVFSVCSSSSW